MVSDYGGEPEQSSPSCARTTPVKEPELIDLDWMMMTVAACPMVLFVKTADFPRHPQHHWWRMRSPTWTIHKMVFLVRFLNRKRAGHVAYSGYLTKIEVDHASNCQKKASQRNPSLPGEDIDWLRDVFSLPECQ